MWEDPIIKETRRLREEYAGQYNHNLEDIFVDICKRQKKSETNYASFSPRKPVIDKKVA